jgi:prephenate dehydratase
MKKILVGVMGGKGSFSEEAANMYCRDQGITEYQLVYLLVAENVLKAMHEGTVDVGIFPIVNSTTGLVEVAFTAVAKYSFAIRKTFVMGIHQNLLVLPGTDVKDISAVVSQKPALGQCRGFLDNNFPDIAQVEYKDTAEAARDLANGTLPPNTAVIANKSCADIYGLEILFEDIEDLKTNATTFVAASKGCSDEKLQSELDRHTGAVNTKGLFDEELLNKFHDAEEQIKTLTENQARLISEKEEVEKQLTDASNRLNVAKVAINEIYEKSLNTWFVPKKLMECIKKCRTFKYLWPEK